MRRPRSATARRDLVAVAALAFAPGTVSPAERGVYAVALSIAVAAVGGLVLQLAIGLDRASWAILLAAVTALAALRGLRAPRRPVPTPRLPWALPLVVVAFAAAGLISAQAIVSAQSGLLDSRARTGFTDFWLAPGSGRGEAFSVGLRSHESRASRYALRLSRAGRQLARREVVLGPGRQRVWEFSLPAGRGRVVASVRQDGQRSRRLYLPFEG